MADLQWRTTAEGCEGGVYRVHRVCGHPKPTWRLDLASPPVRVLAAGIVPAPSAYRSLRGARSAAAHWERERVCHVRMQRHLAVGLAATLALFALAPRATSFVWFVATLVVAGVALGAISRAVDVKLGDGWGRLYEEPSRITLQDRVIVGVVDRLRPRGTGTEPSPAIRVLPPA